MASPLTDAHIEGQRRLRVLTGRAVERLWRSLPAYDEGDVDGWLAQVVPLVGASQRQSVALTEAYLARSLGRQPLGVRPDALTGAGVRNGTDPAEVYRRPFVTLWSKLGEGMPYEDALSAALARAVATAAMDVQLSMRATSDAVEQADPNIYGYQRVADGDACEFCLEVDGAYVKSANAMALHNNCVTGESAVWVPARRSTQASGRRPAHAATRRRYEGEIVVLQTAAGYELRVTPNHPILTDRGWVAAGLLREGDSVVSSRGFDGECGRVPDEQHVPARIEDRFRAGAVAALALVPFTSEQFHGDIGDGEVNVVPLHGGLHARALAALLQPREHFPLSLRSQLASRLACRCRSRKARLLRWAASLGGMGAGCAGLAFAGGLSGGAQDVLLAGGAEANTRANEMAAEPVASDAQSLRQGQHRFAGEIQLDSLREVRGFRGVLHVFNLVTDPGWYMANGIVTHNCGCGLEPLTAPHRRAAKLPSGVAVHEHGEVGPVLTSPDHDFTSETDI